MKKQGLDATQILPNSYNQRAASRRTPTSSTGATCSRTFTPFETKPQPQGLKLYEKWIKKSGGTKSENSIVRVDQRRPVRRPGSRPRARTSPARRSSTRSTRSRTTTPTGSSPPIDWTKAHEQDPQCYAVAEDRRRQVQAGVRQAGQALPVLPGEPEDDPREPPGQSGSGRSVPLRGRRTGMTR